jgi:hypothetical protein
MHRTSDRFWKCLENLPSPIQELANFNFELLKNDPRHPSLHFKKVGKFWSARVGMGYRALAYNSHSTPQDAVLEGFSKTF